MASIVAIIPARSGSKGVADKNIKLLADRPLLAYSIAAARASKNIDRTIVSTDSDTYAIIAREYGADVPFLRPTEISRDNSTDYEFIRHAIDWIKENEGQSVDYLVLLRPTTPLREARHIENAIDLIKANPQATGLRSVHEMSESAYKSVFEIESGQLRCFASGSSDMDAVNLPRQSFKKTFVANGYVDIIDCAFVNSRKRLFGDQVIAYITPRVDEVDTMDDFDYLAYSVGKNPELIQEIFGRK